MLLMASECPEGSKAAPVGAALGAGVSGWMADFSEYLPFDAELHDGVGMQRHNEWPQLWAKVNHEAIQGSGFEEEVVFFMRAGATRSPSYCRLFWMGDQTTSWDSNDGLHSALLGQLSSGMSGWTISHSDVGGYTSLDLSKEGGGRYARDKELLLRWLEMSTFADAMLRTHQAGRSSLGLVVWVGGWDGAMGAVRATGPSSPGRPGPTRPRCRPSDRWSLFTWRWATTSGN